MSDQARKLLFFAIVGLVVWQVLLGGKLPIGPVTPAAPFKTDKLAVLIVEETAARGSYTAGQRAAILSTAPGSLIATVKARNGEYRILDKDQTNFANDAAWVKEAFAVPHPELPWIVAAGPKSGVSQKLPDNAVKLLEGVR